MTFKIKVNNDEEVKKIEDEIIKNNFIYDKGKCQLVEVEIEHMKKDGESFVGFKYYKGLKERLK